MNLAAHIEYREPASLRTLPRTDSIFKSMPWPLLQSPPFSPAGSPARCVEAPVQNSYAATQQLSSKLFNHDRFET
jgi:hypothetical protein